MYLSNYRARSYAQNIFCTPQSSWDNWFMLGKISASKLIKSWMPTRQRFPGVIGSRIAHANKKSCDCIPCLLFVQYALKEVLKTLQRHSWMVSYSTSRSPEQQLRSVVRLLMFLLSEGVLSTNVCASVKPRGGAHPDSALKSSLPI